MTALAADADATDGVTYALSDDAGGLFAIDGSTGVVTVNGALDYETATSHTLTVRATSTDGSFSTRSFTITVTDVNESGVGAISDTDGSADFVAENSAVGTAVGVTALASDPDGGDTVSYSLDDSAGGRFTINGSTGEVTVAGGIDREAAGSYDITVRATSTDTSFTTKTFTITIGDVDEFDVTAPADVDPGANAVDENAANGTAVGITASASDADATTNGVTYSLDDDAGGREAPAGLRERARLRSARAEVEQADALDEITTERPIDVVLDLNAGSGLLTWEILRRTPEGGTWALARDRQTAA